MLLQAAKSEIIIPRKMGFMSSLLAGALPAAVHQLVTAVFGAQAARDARKSA
jgi:hypothetical protein